MGRATLEVEEGEEPGWNWSRGGEVLADVLLDMDWLPDVDWLPDALERCVVAK